MSEQKRREGRANKPTQVTHGNGFALRVASWQSGAEDVVAALVFLLKDSALTGTIDRDAVSRLRQGQKPHPLQNRKGWAIPSKSNQEKPTGHPPRSSLGLSK